MSTTTDKNKLKALTAVNALINDIDCPDQLKELKEKVNDHIAVNSLLSALAASDKPIKIKGVSLEIDYDSRELKVTKSI